VVAEVSPRSMYEASVVPEPVAVLGDAIAVAVSVVRSEELP
jgi:hypothetical protein